MSLNRPIASARSWLFVPGDKPERFSKALSSSDVVILDLKDAVSPDRKTKARANVLAFLAAGSPVLAAGFPD